MERTTTTDAFMRGFYKVAYDAGLTPDQAAEMHAVAIINEAKFRSPDFARGFDKVAAPKSPGPGPSPMAANAAPGSTPGGLPKVPKPITPAGRSPQELELRQMEMKRKVNDREAIIAANAPGGTVRGRGEITENDNGLTVRRPAPTVSADQDPYGYLPSTPEANKIPRDALGRIPLLGKIAPPPNTPVYPTYAPSTTPAAQRPAAQRTAATPGGSLPSDNPALKALLTPNSAGELDFQVRTPSGVTGARG